LQGRPSAPPEQCQADFWSRKTVAACLFHAPPPPMKPTKPVDWERLLLHYLPTPTVRVTVTYNKIKNAQTAVGFNFSFLYRSAPGPSFLLCFFFFCRWQIWWLGGSYQVVGLAVAGFVCRVEKLRNGWPRKGADL
jgi:hypothetical protein